MAFVEWTDKLSVGVVTIDQQHRRLIALINQLHDAMTVGKGQAVLGPVVAELVAYTKSHFAHEEQLLRIHKYPDLAVHQGVHATFTGDVLGLQKQLETGQSVLTMDVMSFLRTWLVDHIMQTDQKYAPHLKSAGVR